MKLELVFPEIRLWMANCLSDRSGSAGVYTESKSMKSLDEDLPLAPSSLSLFVRPSKMWDPQPRPGSLVFVGGKFLPGCATPVIGTIQDKNIIWDTDTQLTLTAAVISHWESEESELSIN